MITNERTFTQCLFHVRACVVLHNMTLGMIDDSFWDDVDMEAMEAEWEGEEAEIGRLMEGEDADEQGRHLPVERGEEMREALRYRFQVTDYRKAYSKDDPFDF